MARIRTELTPTDAEPWMYVNPKTGVRNIGSHRWAREIHAPKKIVFETAHLIAYRYGSYKPLLILIHKDLIDGDT